MTQTILTPTVIAKEALPMLVNNLVFARRVNRRYQNEFVSIGTTLKVPKPIRFIETNGKTLQTQQLQEPSIDVVIDTQVQRSFKFSSADRTLSVTRFREKFLVPAMASAANQIDKLIASQWVNVSNAVGTAASTPTSFATSVQLTGQRLDENGAPGDGRTLVLNPKAHWSIAAGLQNAFVTKVSEPALIRGYLSTIGGHDIYMDQNIQVSPASTYGGSPLTNGATAQTGASLVTDGWTASTTVLKQGTSFTIDGVYAVNPQSRQSTGNLMNFVVTADTVTDSSGNSTIAISPAITASGAYQNVTNGAANNKAITILTGLTTAATTVNNLAFERDAFGLVCVPLEIPPKTDGARETYEDISMRVLNVYDVNNDDVITRIDILCGAGTYYDELAVKLLG